MSNKTKKISYVKPGFIIPVVYSTITAVIMGLVYLVSNNPRMFSEEISTFIMNAGYVSLLLSPSALIVCGSLSLKHRNKFPLESFFYSDMPVALSFLVMGFQLFYLAAISM